MNTHLLDELQIRCNKLELQNNELQYINFSLRESLNRLSDHITSTPAGHLTITQEGLIQSIDLNAAKTLGLENLNSPQKLFSEFVVDQERNHWQQILRSLAQSSERQSFELTLRHENGLNFFAKLDCLPSEDESEPFSIEIRLFDIPERRIAGRRFIEDELRIAATVFESQIGFIVTGADEVILKVNKAFSDITGYTSEDIVGHTPRVLSSGQHDRVFYSAMWDTIKDTGAWQGEIWNRRKTGEIYPEFMTITAVTNVHGQITNYVATLTDSAKSKQQEQQRLAEESAHREALVREVHHRIKNNLQGVTGVLRNFAALHPELEVPMSEAIGQVQSIAIIHGLQGRTPSTSIRLCELIHEIALNVKFLWNAPIEIDIPSDWTPYLIGEANAVPIALVLNELISNAIKHGDKSKGVNITIRPDRLPFMVQVVIKNPGRLPPDFNYLHAPVTSTGLQLVSTLLPKNGAKLTFECMGDFVTAQLKFGPATITPENLKGKKID